MDEKLEFSYPVTGPNDGSLFMVSAMQLTNPYRYSVCFSVAVIAPFHIIGPIRHGLLHTIEHGDCWQLLKVAKGNSLQSLQFTLKPGWTLQLVVKLDVTEVPPPLPLLVEEGQVGEVDSLTESKEGPSATGKKVQLPLNRSTSKSSSQTAANSAMKVQPETKQAQTDAKKGAMPTQGTNKDAPQGDGKKGATPSQGCKPASPAESKKGEIIPKGSKPASPAEANKGATTSKGASKNQPPADAKTMTSRGGKQTTQDEPDAEMEVPASKDLASTEIPPEEIKLKVELCELYTIFVLFLYY